MHPGAEPHRRYLAGLAGLDDDLLGLAETAFALAATSRPQADTAEYLGHRDRLAARLGPPTRDAAAQAKALAEVMAVENRYRGDDRDDDQVCNGNLMWVVDHRQGVASALGILYLDVALSAGWKAVGLNFPGHLLVRVEDEDGRRAIVNPFARGAVVQPPDLRHLLKATAGSEAELEPGHFAPAGNRDILVRLQNDIKLRLLRCGLVSQALDVVETVLLFAPNHAALWRECGLMHLRLGRPKAAASALEQFLARTDNDGARRRTLQMLQDIRQRLL